MLKSLVLSLLLLPSVLHAWDASGHMLVGQVAWELSPLSTRSAVNELVGTLESRFNEGRPYHFVTVGCWMDDLRSLPRSEYPWSAWHYVDGPKTADGSAFSLPKPPHVVWAIDQNLATLRDPASPREQKARALGQLIHWVGDIHQPLHATTWDDRGGNGYAVMGVPFSDLMHGVLPSLHTYWDKAFRFDASEGHVKEAWRGPSTQKRPGQPGEGVIAEQAALLLKKYPTASLAELRQDTGAEGWARESHVLGCTVGYPPGDHPRDTAARPLEPEFVRQNRAVAEKRVVLAGHRLAKLLKELFP